MRSRSHVAPHRKALTALAGAGICFAFFFLFSAHTASAAGCTGTGSCYWVGGTGNATDTTKWATTSGGATTGGAPSATDNCIFDSASNATAYTVTVNGTLACKSISFAAPGTSGNVTLAGSSALNLTGTWTGYAGLVNSYTGTITMNGAAGPYNITSAGVAFGSSITINTTGAGALGEYDLADNLTLGSTQALTLTQGIFDAKTFDVSVGLFSSNNSNTRTLTMGSGTWTVTGNNNTVWSNNAINFTLNRGNPVVFNYSGSTGTRAMASGCTPGGSSSTCVEAKAIDANVTAGTDLFMTGSMAGVRNLNFTGFHGTWTTQSVGALIFGNLTLDPGMTTSDASNALHLSPSLGNTSILTTNGVYLNRFTMIVGLGTVQLADDLNSVEFLIFSGGNFDANDHNVNVRVTETYIGQLCSSGKVTGSVHMGSGTWSHSQFIINGTGISSGANCFDTDPSFVLDAGTSTVVYTTNSTVNYFALGGYTYHNIQITGSGTAPITLIDSNTFNTFTVSTPPHTVQFGGGTTNTACTWNLSGTAGNANTISSTTTTPATLAVSCSTASLEHLTASYLTLTPACNWTFGSGFVDGGNNDRTCGAGSNPAGSIRVTLSISGGSATLSDVSLTLNTGIIDPNLSYPALAG
ncbi:MAG: hypothetical protein IT405_01150, partial [Candidatus Yanofskybacteria bacterium]|nr:hypothetical protein [Candidatus Yanofskybacteria bacterium]